MSDGEGGLPVAAPDAGPKEEGEDEVARADGPSGTGGGARMVGNGDGAMGGVVVGARAGVGGGMAGRAEAEQAGDAAAAEEEGPDEAEGRGALARGGEEGGAVVLEAEAPEAGEGLEGAAEAAGAVWGDGGALASAVRSSCLPQARGERRGGAEGEGGREGGREGERRAHQGKEGRVTRTELLPPSPLPLLPFPSSSCF